MVSATNNITIVASLQDRLSKPLQNIDRSTSRLEKQFTKLSGAVQNAFQFYVRYRIFSLISQGISAIENAIPGLISRGQEWAQTVDEIADTTGLAAERSSLLAGTMQMLIGDTEGLSRALGALAATTVNHGDVLKRYGIATKDANGHLLDSWTVLQNVRKALSDVGNSFITTAAARELFSRGGQTLIDFLTLSDAQFKLLTRDMKESGIIMSEAGLRAAEAWQRTQQRFELTITGIANQVTQTVQPLLSRLVDGITNYLRENMANIVGFVTGVISFVAGAIAGFLGIDISGQVKTMAEQLDALSEGTGKRERALSRSAKAREEQTASEDGYTRALNGQIAAIDRQLAAMAKADNAEDARREHAKLLKDISEAKKQLRDLRGEGIFAAGMSAAEAELARQAQAADIVDAQKAVREAQQKLNEQERDTARENRRIELQERKEMLQQRLSDHIKMLAEEAAADRAVMAQAFGAGKGGIGGIPQSIAEVMAAGQQGLLQADVGTKWGEQFRTSLEGFFDDLNDPNTGLGAMFAGLVSVGKTVADNWQLVAAAGAAIIALNLASSIVGLVGAIGGAAGLTAAIAGPAGLTAALLGPLGLIAAVGGAALALGVITANSDVAKKEGLLENAARVDRMNPNKDVYADFWQGLANSGVPLGVFGVHKQEPKPRGDNLFSKLRDAMAAQLTTIQQQQTLLATALAEGGTLPTALANMTAAVAPDSPLVTTQATIAAALGDEGKLAALQRNAAQMQAYVAPSAGRSISQHLSRIGDNTATLNTNTPWGIANVHLYIDKRVAMTMLGIPIQRGNSTTRHSPSQ